VVYDEYRQKKEEERKNKKKSKIRGGKQIEKMQER